MLGRGYLMHISYLCVRTVLIKHCTRPSGRKLCLNLLYTGELWMIIMHMIIMCCMM